MKTLQSLVLAVLVLGTSACASHASKQSPADSLSQTPSATATPIATSTEASLASETSGLIPSNKAPDKRTDHEVAADAPLPPAPVVLAQNSSAPLLEASKLPAVSSPADIDLLDSADEEAEVLDSTKAKDPWEGYNRRMYTFNTKVDKYIAYPIGVAYDTVVPNVVQRRVTSFFANLKEPRNMVNQLLQGRPLGAARTLARFVVNTTAGVAGIFDPASQWKLPRANEDLGQTLAVWGWHNSRFFVAPVQGPRTVRDFISGFGDKPLNPTGYIDDGGVSAAVAITHIGSARSGAFPFDKMRADAFDEYAFVRDTWMQRRKHQIDDRR